MLYKKNLPPPERVVRLVGAALMALCAIYFAGTTVGWVLAIIAVVSVVTSLVGFCPLCAIAGRKPTPRGGPSTPTA